MRLVVPFFAIALACAATAAIAEPHMVIMRADHQPVPVAEQEQAGEEIEEISESCEGLQPLEAVMQCIKDAVKADPLLKGYVAIETRYV